MESPTSTSSPRISSSSSPRAPVAFVDRAPPSPTSSNSPPPSAGDADAGSGGRLAELHATLAALRASQNRVEALIAAELQHPPPLASEHHRIHDRSVSPAARTFTHSIGSPVPLMRRFNPISNERSTSSPRHRSPSPSSPVPSCASVSASDPAFWPRSSATPALVRRPSMNIGALLNPTNINNASSPLPSPLNGPSTGANLPLTSPGLLFPEISPRSTQLVADSARQQQLGSSDTSHTHNPALAFGLTRSHVPPLRVQVDHDGQVPSAAWHDRASYSPGSSGSLSPRVPSLGHPGPEDYAMHEDVVTTPSFAARHNSGPPTRPPPVHSSSASSTDSMSSMSSMSSISSSSSGSAKAHLSPATRALLSGPPLRRPTQARGPKRHLQQPSGSDSASAKPAKELPFRCSQEGCTAAFARRFELDRHTRTHQNGPGSGVACPICGNVFRAARKDALRRHQLESIGCLRLQARLTAEELRALDCVTDDDRQRLQWQRQSTSLSSAVQQQKRGASVLRQEAGPAHLGLSIGPP